MIFVGIDVAKDKHDCFITNSDGEILFKVFTIPNTLNGFNDLYGAYSSNEKNPPHSVNYSDNGDNETKFKIRDNGSFKYPFMSSEKNTDGLAFYKPEDFNGNATYRASVVDNANNWYYVYNYGFKITYWKVYYINNVSKYYLSYSDDGEWSIVGTTETLIPVDNLIKTSNELITLALSSLLITTYFSTNGDIVLVYEELEIPELSKYKSTSPLFTASCKLLLSL